MSPYLSIELTSALVVCLLSPLSQPSPSSVLEQNCTGPKATQVISIGLGRTMERKRNSEHLKKTAPEAEMLLK
ncbi:hypothetical protein MTR_2g438830 [Medicago truncatula]|uniref:Transmembrane protein n=1 Tax=Medicago truncatula TaxID=3880 RepID=A0A072V6L8_MEDTR|nr:hypothetical protein MTR_2g438830 [Medicago truncatula]